MSDTEFTRKEAIELLKAGKIAEFNVKHQALRRAHEKLSLQSFDSHGLDLRGLKLQGIDLRGADLRGFDLRGADLQEANLREAKLQGADLQEANLRKADLRLAELQSANLREAELQKAKLWADLQGAKLQKANLQDAVLWGAKLQGADLQEANLRKAFLQEASLHGANLRKADLRGADLHITSLQGTNLQEANLRGAYLYGANLLGADLSSVAGLNYARFSNATTYNENEDSDKGIKRTRFPENFDPKKRGLQKVVATAEDFKSTQKPAAAEHVVSVDLIVQQKAKPKFKPKKPSAGTKLDTADVTPDYVSSATFMADGHTPTTHASRVEAKGVRHIQKPTDTWGESELMVDAATNQQRGG